MRANRWMGVLGLVLSLFVAPAHATVSHQTDSATAQRVFLPIVTRQNTPPFSTSHYIESANPDFFRKLRCATAQELQTKGIADGFVYLFFGQPAYKEPIRGESSGYGTLMLSRSARFASIAEIRAAVQSWVDGYLQGYDDLSVFPCPKARLPLPRVTLSVATSNLPISITKPASLATLLPQTTVESYTSLHGTLLGADDQQPRQLHQPKKCHTNNPDRRGNNIELNWNTPRLTREWVNGYNLLANFSYYNAGACEAKAARNAPPMLGCPVHMSVPGRRKISGAFRRN